jgi:hypothetical protein
MIETDWSVDRFDNDCGYTPEDIVNLSTLANQAKTVMDSSDILKKALRKTQSDDLLSASEWQRMA